MFLGRISGVLNKDGKVTEDAEEYKKVWAEYFKELLNDNRPNEEVEIEEDEEGETVTDPTMEEVKEVINKSRKGKAPGKDGINMELIKYGGEELQKQIHALIQTIWREEKMPEEWKTGQIVTIQKRRPKEMRKLQRNYIAKCGLQNPVNNNTKKASRSNERYSETISVWFHSREVDDRRDTHHKTDNEEGEEVRIFQ